MSWLLETVHGHGFRLLFRPARHVYDPVLHEVIQAKGRKAIIKCNERIEPLLGENDRRDP